MSRAVPPDDIESPACVRPQTAIDVTLIESLYADQAALTAAGRLGAASDPPASGVYCHQGIDDTNLRLFGEVDFASVTAIRDHSTDALASLLPLVVDLAEVTFLDSMGMTMLVDWSDRPRGMTVRNVPPHIRRHLSLIALDEVLVIEE